MPLRRLALLALLVAAIAAAVIWLPLRDWLAFGIAWIDRHPALAWPAYVGAYIVATVLVLPGSILTLAAGFVFGLPVGVVLTSIGSTLGACCAFVVGRYLARAWVETHIASHAGFKALDAATHHEGFVIVFLARLSPVFPFNLLNYGLALTAVRFRDYALASWLGMLPATVLYVYIGTAAGSFSELTRGEAEGRLAGQALLVAGLAATVLLVVLITRKATQALRTHLRREAGEAEPGTAE